MIFGKSRLNGQSLLVLTVIFAISVLVRFPNINRPLSKHHEFVTAISLRVLQIWHEEGGSTCGYSPVMTYSGDANKHINNHASTIKYNVEDTEGNYYYLSHPPLAYIVPHFVFKAINVKPTVLGLQIFHLFINFFSGILIYILVLNLKGIRARSGIDRTALTAFVIYTFSTAVLWFQCNTYMSDMFVHFFFLLGILFGLKCLSYPSSTKWKIFFAVNLFLMIYTSWLGVFFAFVVFVGGLTIWRKNNGVHLAVFTFLSGISALLLIYFQYSSITGSDALVDHLSQRLYVRGSGTGGREGSYLSIKLTEIGRIIFNYGTNYFVLILMILVAFVIGWKKSIVKLGEMKSYVLLSGVPILLLHLLLLNYSGQDFTVLYASCFLSITGAFLIENQVKIARPFVLWFIVLGSVGMYYYINKPGDYSRSGERYDTSKKLGLMIREEAKDDEVVYLISDELNPMVVVYAERNIIHVGKNFKGKFPYSNLTSPTIYFFAEKGLEPSMMRNDDFDKIRH